MNNKTGFNRLSRRAGHRRALIKNMVTSLLTYERITTTRAKAMEIRRHAEKIVTRAKVDSVHNRREVAKVITKGEVLTKLFTVLGPRFQSRAGGYTRVLKLGQRPGDAAEMVILEFVERTSVVAEQAPAEPKSSKKSPAKAAPAKAAPKAASEDSTATEAPVKKSRKKAAAE